MRKIKKTILVETIVRVPINSVKLFGKNPRVNTDAAKKLSRLIKKFGQRSPIVVWKKNMVIYKGNTTWKAMKILNANLIKVIFHDFKSEAEAVAYSISDNKSSEWSGWDEDVLIKLMEAEEMKEFKVATGFSKDDLDILLVDTFAGQTYGEVADEFSRTHKDDDPGKGEKFWFWFEVKDKEKFEDIKKRFGRLKGKRLHRELDWDRIEKSF